MKPRNYLAIRLATWLLITLAFVLVLALNNLRAFGQVSQTAARIELGRELFFERQLSIDGSTSCGTCHDPRHGYTRPERLAVGLRGNSAQPQGFIGQFNSPTVLNAVFKGPQFHNGRAANIATQALQPWTNPIEMGLRSNLQGLQRLAAVDGGAKYGPLFQAAYGSPVIDEARCADALAHFESTLVVDDAPIQRYLRGDEEALTARQLAGYEVFKTSNCTACHGGQDLRTVGFRNDGWAYFSDPNVQARSSVTGRGAPRRLAVPTLIHVGDTAPYMHDGSANTLAQVVAYYNTGGQINGMRDPSIDPAIRPLNLSSKDFWSLVWFLESATRGTFPFTGDPATMARQ